MVECMRTDAKKSEPAQWILKRYLFRGERREDREWVEGFLFVVNDVPYILPYHNTGQPIHVDNLLKTAIEVLEDTVCQCTEQYDKNGKLIWEDDIVKCGNTTELVGWDQNFASWRLPKRGWFYRHIYGDAHGSEDCEVIGNIFDNLDRLEDSDE